LLLHFPFFANILFSKKYICVSQHSVFSNKFDLSQKTVLLLGQELFVEKWFEDNPIKKVCLEKICLKFLNGALLVVNENNTVLQFKLRNKTPSSI